VVGVNAWVVHTDENIWGKDVHEFRPQRWLVDKERLAFLDQNYLAVSRRLLIISKITLNSICANNIYSLVLVQEHASAKISHYSK
jgi:hypothetical protein